MLGAQEENELPDFILRKGIVEGRHFLAAVLDLIGHLNRGHGLANAGQGGSLGGACGGGSMAVGAAFVAEEDGACQFRLLPGGGSRCGTSQ